MRNLGVVVAMGNAYRTDGTLIMPKSFDGFYEEYESYTVTGPAVKGVIPCKALYMNKTAYGQCFYMDVNGNVTHVFPSADDENTLGYTLAYAPDSNSGKALVQFKAGDRLLIWPLDDVDGSPGVSIFMTSCRYRSDGTMFHHGFMPVQMMDEEGSWCLLRQNIVIGWFLTDHEPEGEPTHWISGGLNFEAAGCFGSGAGDDLCPVKIDGRWRYARLTLTDKNFSDVIRGAYYLPAVQWATDHNPVITTGTSTTTFSPNATCTRAQVVTFLWRAKGTPEPKTTNNPFTDVEEGQYYYKAVLWAVAQGITNGTSDNTFSPDATCTRGQIVTFLYRDLA